MEQFNDLFHSMDNYGDSLQYTNEELDHYFKSNHLNSHFTNEDFFEDDMFNQLTAIFTMKQEQADEIVLSQKLSELSTHYEMYDASSAVSNKRPLPIRVTSVNLNAKKFKMPDTDTDTGDENESIGDDTFAYLSIENHLFMDMTNNLIQSNRTLRIHDIQNVARIIHQIGVLHIKQDMNSICLQSVNGTLSELIGNMTDVDRRVWPLQVKSMMLTNYGSFTDNLNNMDRRFQPICEDLLRRKIREVEQEIEQLQKQLDYQRKALPMLNSTVEKIIQDFVQLNGLKPFKIKTDFKIAIIKHEYEAEILQRLFSKENLNTYQIQFIENLFHCKREQEKSRQALLEFKERIFCNKLSSTLVVKTMTNEKLNHYQKLDLLINEIKQMEQHFYEYQLYFDTEFASLLEMHRQSVSLRALTAKQINLVILRVKNIINRWRDIHRYRLNYYVQNAYDKLKEIPTNKQANMNSDVLLSTLIIDTKHSLTNRQLRLLNRGPTYVPPCQMFVSSSLKSQDDIVKQQWAPLEYQLNRLFTKYNIDSMLSIEIQKKISEKFNENFHISLPDNIQRRALYENKLIQSIQASLTTNNLILRRTANHKNMFYLGNRSEFDNQVHEYLSRLDLYEVVSNQFNETNNKLNDMTQSIHLLLDGHACKQYLSNINNMKISQAYFLPNISTMDNGIQIVPLILPSQTATWQLGLFLDRILRPMICEILESMVFHDEIDFMNKIYQYANVQQRLQSKTLFCTIKITNFYELDTHTNLISMVVQFLERYVPAKKRQNISIATIRNLLTLFLENNFFAYQDKTYRFIKGSPTTMPLTETLSSIYLLPWQQHISNSIQGKEEVFGRYKDHIFLTLNNFNDKDIRSCLQTLKENYPQVQFARLIGPCAIYMNTHIENRSGILYTRVHHSSPLEKYTLPYVNGHAKSIYSDWLRSALFQAICSCSNVDDFQEERISLELTYLINGYSLSFVQTHLKHFFNYFNANEMQYSMRQSLYDPFRQQCFTYLESKRTPTEQHRDIDDSSPNIHFYYIYEYGSKCQFHRQFYHLWSQYFDHHPILSNKTFPIRISPKDFHSLNDLLTQ